MTMNATDIKAKTPNASVVQERPNQFESAVENCQPFTWLVSTRIQLVTKSPPCAGHSIPLNKESA